MLQHSPGGMVVTSTTHLQGHPPMQSDMLFGNMWSHAGGAGDRIPRQSPLITPYMAPHWPTPGPPTPDMAQRYMSMPPQYYAPYHQLFAQQAAVAAQQVSALIIFYHQL